MGESLTKTKGPKFRDELLKRLYDHTILSPPPYMDKDFGHPGCPICERARNKQHKKELDELLKRLCGESNDMEKSLIKIAWIPVEDNIFPEPGRPVLISNGDYVVVAEFYRWTDVHGNKRHSGYKWIGYGFSGFEWEWDFDPTHWAEIPFALPPMKRAEG